MRICACGLIAISLLVGALSAQDDAGKKDLDSIQGVWQAISAEIEGKPASGELIKRLKLTFKGNKVSHPAPDGKIEEVTFKLDPSKNPKTIDVTASSDTDKSIVGIYSIEGDTLKICATKAGQERPKEFKSGNDVANFVFMREKQ